MGDTRALSCFITKTGTNNQLDVDADVLNGSLRLLGTGFNPTCSMSFYAIGLGDDDSSGYTGEPNASLAKVTLGVAEKTTIDHVTETGLNVNIPNSEIWYQCKYSKHRGTTYNI